MRNSRDSLSSKRRWRTRNGLRSKTSIPWNAASSSLLALTDSSETEHAGPHVHADRCNSWNSKRLVRLQEVRRHFVLAPGSQ